MTKAEIFKSAWTDAHYCASVMGGKAKEYFAECLKKSHMLNRINGASFKQKEYAVDVAYKAISVLAEGACQAIIANKDAYASAAYLAIAKINKMTSAKQILDSLLNVNFHKGFQLKEWHSKN
ncbi:hypothetical protein C5E26_07750 [Pectobacterium parmentieri]|uniref:hypothetical protein n=1 Tax=Pectobacterium parmentieri TaxID=1905730 RepID=UPI000EB35386|nr:hypothetical protein [Pectobacterium parmentieri]AYH00840.1 hypothetical protein C5E26_07750 [Pectobacterium parmentieri]AYH27148.1 hypothetical protein C5E20_08390 [Pectobacterium parmentieri]